MEVKSPGIEDSLLTPEDNEDEERQPESVKSVQSKGASFALWLGPFFVRQLRFDEAGLDGLSDC